MLVRDFDLKLLDIVVANRSGEDDIFFRRLQHRQDAIQVFRRVEDKESDRMRLALVLASTEDAVISPVILESTVLNPMVRTGAAFFYPTSYSPFPTVEIDSNAKASIRKWLNQLDHHPESLWLGARRLVRAVTDRQDPLDGFIDAVVCWENMLGSDEGEATFRVCASLAVLLEPDIPQNRQELLKEFRTLYAARSKLVHGAREPEQRHAGALRDRAVHVAIRGMRELYNRPELLSAASSTERSRILLLGA